MAIPTREATLLVDAEPPTAMTSAPAAAAEAVSLFERLARDPSVDVEKLERLIGMQERILAHAAKSAFNTAFAAMQGDIPTIVEHGKTDKGTYARLEDIIDKVRPVLKRHGFTLSHRTEWPDAKTVKVIGILTHQEGHERTSEFLSSADQTGSKNAIQALGSAVSYGRRYTTKDLLAIVTTDEDDDGGKSEDFKKAEAPAGYDDWLLNMTACADEGWPKLSQAFGKSKPEYRGYATRQDKSKWEALKHKAEQVTKGAK
jgi:hypothetical protein